MNATQFVLIRHGESVWNARGRWQGHGDSPLSGRGREQAARLAAELADEGIDVIVASDLARAAETAAILGSSLELTPVFEPRLRELDVGSWTGLTRDEIEALGCESLERFEGGDPEVRPGGGESRREIRVRVRGTVAEIAERHAGQLVAIVAHLGVVRALLPGTELANAEWCRAAASEIASVDSAGEKT